MNLNLAKPRCVRVQKRSQDVQKRVQSGRKVGTTWGRAEWPAATLTATSLPFPCPCLFYSYTLRFRMAWDVVLGCTGPPVRSAACPLSPHCLPHFTLFGNLANRIQSNLQDLVSEYMQYQEASADDEIYDDEELPLEDEEEI